MPTTMTAPKIATLPNAIPVSQLVLPTKRASRQKYPLNADAVDLVDRYMRHLAKDERIDGRWLQVQCAKYDPAIGALDPRQFMARYILFVARQHRRATGEYSLMMKDGWSTRKDRMTRAQIAKNAATARWEKVRTEKAAAEEAARHQQAAKDAATDAVGTRSADARGGQRVPGTFKVIDTSAWPRADEQEGGVKIEIAREGVDHGAAITQISDKLMAFVDQIRKEQPGLRETLTLIDQYAEDIYRAVA